MPDNSTFMRRLNIIIVVVAVVMALYHLVSTQFLFQTFLEHQNNHFAFALVLVLLVTMRKRPKMWPWIAFIMVLGIVGTAYMKINFDPLQERVGFPSTWDVIIGICLVFVALETSRMAFGWIIPGLCLLFIAYMAFGHLIPGPLHHTRFNLDYLVTNLCMGFQGMFGTSLSVSVNYIFLFFLFGGILQKTGALDFFTSLGKLAGRRLRGGPAQTAIISSAFVGSITGSALANVAITGPFTIPLMKKTGYTAEQAGAVEASASVGGQIMPPIMGAQAFLMAAFTGIAYVDIMIAFLIPALLYFLCLGIFVEFQARAQNVQPFREAVDMHDMFVKMPCFVIPILVLVILLLMGKTAMFCAFWGIIALVVVSMAVDYFVYRKIYFRKLIAGMVEGAIGGAKIGVTSAAIGFLMVAITTTGLGMKISVFVTEWSYGILLITLIITMFISLLFGMGVPTMVAYALVAITVAPALVKLGVPLLQAHAFCTFFAIFSNTTPPVALGSLVASTIANSNYFKTAIYAFKLSLIAFILPYIMIYNPNVLMEFTGFIPAALTLLSIIMGIFCLSIFFTRFFLCRLTIFQKALVGICGIFAFAYVFTLQLPYVGMAIALFVILTLWQKQTKKTTSPAAAMELVVKQNDDDETLSVTEEKLHDLMDSI